MPKSLAAQFCCLFLLCFSAAHAQKIPVRVYPSGSALPQAYITAIAQDHKGFMWFISSAGLTRYDGVDFRNYTKQDGLTSNVGISVAEDRHGQLWALMVNGISVLEVNPEGYIKTIRRIDPRGGLSNLENTCLLLDREGFLWIGSRSGEVTRYRIDQDGSTIKLFPTLLLPPAPSQGSDIVTAIFQDKENRFWIGTEAGLKVLEFTVSGTFTETRFTRNNGLGSEQITSIAQSPSGEIWIGTRSGLSKLVDILSSKNKIKFKNFTAYDGLINNDIRGIAVDIPGNLWIATAGGVSKLNFSEATAQASLSYQRNFTVTNYAAENGLLDNTCRTVFADRENNIWIASASGGVSKISSEKFHTLTVAEGLAGESPGPIVADASGRIWIGTGNGISAIDITQDISSPRRYTIHNFGRRSGLSDLAIHDLAIDANGILYAATEGGIMRFSAGSFYPYINSHELTSPDVRQIEFDHTGQIWIGTISGLNRYSANGIKTLHRKDGLPSDNIRKILKDHQGNLWIGTNRGLCRIDHDQVAVSSPRIDPLDKLDLPEKIINDLHEDRQHMIWIGADDALIKVETDDDHDIKGTVRIDLEQAGFLNTKIKCIEQDASGFIWITTGRGLHQLDPEKLSVINVYFQSDGLAGNEGSQEDAMTVDKQGNMWISFYGGVTRYLPKVDFEYTRSVPLYIKRFTANNVAHAIDQPIELSYDDRNIEVSFGGLLFRNEESLQFQYRLNGFDQRWSSLSGERQVRYTNLDHGHYSFQCRTVSFHNKETHDTVELKFVILPPFWKQWWFFILVPLGLAGLGYLAYQNRIKIIKKRNEELEHRIQLRTQEVKKQNEEINRQREILERQKRDLENTIRELTRTQTDLIHTKKMASLVQIVAGIAHEMNNPLASIYGNATHLKEYIGDLTRFLEHIDSAIIKHRFQSSEEFESVKAEIKRFKESIDYDYVLRDIQNILGSFEKSGFRMMQIVKDLRKFSRLDESEIKEVNINETLGNIVELFLSQYRFSIKVETFFSPLPPILCYPQELSQAFMQILLNAAQAILEYQEYALQEIKNEGSTIYLDVDRGHIRIETKLIEEASLKDLEWSLQAIDSGIKRSIIQIKIRDDGIGIPEDAREKIFDPFFTTRKIGEGIGLGLSVAYSIIEKHQGKIFYSTERFEGTEFIVELPLRNNLLSA